MCGICGFSGQPNEQLVKKMTDTLEHRGPDDEGFYVGDGINLGMRRLSIIDLAGGHQPLVNEDETIRVVLNGEIYNFLELTEWLKNKGHKFSTRSDTETIVHLYEECGLAFPSKLNGMFAIALWDSRAKKLILVRDRIGIKPLYYFFKNGKIIFGSEIKAILAHPLYEKEINYESLHHFLSLKHVPAPGTIFKDIFSLLPGEALVYKEGSLKKKKYWEVEFNEDKNIGEAEAAGKILEILKDAVKLQMRSDVTVGAYLSGGLDSSSVVALMSQFTSKPINTFCLGYEDGFQHKIGDLEAARRVSRLFGTRHREYIMSWQEIPDKMGEVIRSFDEPFAGVVSTFFISQLIKKHVKVALSGDGGDEIFGSYLSHRLAAPMARFFESRNNAQGAPGRESLFLSDRDRRILSELADKDAWRWRSRLAVFKEEDKREFYGKALRSKTRNFSTERLWKKYFEGTTAGEATNRVLEAEFKTIFPDQVLAFSDRLSMAHSIELRPPLLDHRLVELAATLPGSYKIKNGVNKYIFKKAAENLLPADIINRPKEGFVLPLNQWLRVHLREYVIETLSVGRLRRHGFFDGEVVEAMIKKYYQDEADYHSLRFIENSNKLWELLVFQLWWEEYFN